VTKKKTTEGDRLATIFQIITIT